MDATPGEPPPPNSTDLAGWRQAVADGRLRKFPWEAIVAAFQDLGPNSDRTVWNALARHLNDEIYTRLRRNVGRNHPNEGEDIINRAHVQLFEALALPHSADGKGMRKAFGSRVMFRLKDAIAKEAMERRVPDEATAGKRKKAKKVAKPANGDEEEDKFVEIGEHPDLAEEPEPSEGEERAPSKVQHDPTLMDGVRDADQKIFVDRFLQKNIADDRKRLAFRLYMDGIPYKSKNYESIAKAMGIDEKTAREWIKEIQEQLQKEMKVGDKT